MIKHNKQVINQWYEIKIYRSGTPRNGVWWFPKQSCAISVGNVGRLSTVVPKATFDGVVCSPETSKRSKSCKESFDMYIDISRLAKLNSGKILTKQHFDTPMNK